MSLRSAALVALSLHSACAVRVGEDEFGHVAKDNKEPPKTKEDKDKHADQFNPDKASGKTDKPPIMDHHKGQPDAEMISKGHFKIMAGTGRFSKGLDPKTGIDEKKGDTTKRVTKIGDTQPGTIDPKEHESAVERRNQAVQVQGDDGHPESAEAPESVYTKMDLAAKEKLDESLDPASKDEKLDPEKLANGEVKDKGKRDQNGKVPFHRSQTNQTRLLDLIRKSTIPANSTTGDAPAPKIPGDKLGITQAGAGGSGSETVCSGWTPSDPDKPLFQQGNKCGKNGWSLPWCWVDADQYREKSPGEDEFMKHSAIYPGKFFAMCKPDGDDNDTNASGNSFQRKAEHLATLAKAMRNFAKTVKYNASLKIAKADRAEYDLARMQEKASEVRGSARKSQRDAEEQQEAAKIIAFQADVAAKKQIAQLDKDLNRIKKSEEEDAMDAHNIRLNVTRKQAQAEHARQQQEEVNEKAEDRVSNAHKVASDLARKAEEANKLAEIAEEEAQKAERKKLETEKAVPATTTYAMETTPEEEETTPFPGSEEDTTTSTTAAEDVVPEALGVFETNYKKIKAGLSREDGFNLGRTYAEAAAMEAEELVRDALAMPVSNQKHVNFEVGTPMAEQNKKQADRVETSKSGKTLEDKKKDDAKNLEKEIQNEANVEEAIKKAEGEKGGRLMSD